MVATIQDMPVAQLYLVEPIANTGVGGQVTFYWNEGDNGAFKAVDNVEANDTLITEGFLALSALKGTTGMEYVYVTGGTSNYLSDGIRQVTYTLTARGLPPTNKSNPPSAGFSRFYKSHLADALCVFSETTLTRSLAESFAAATTTQSVVAGEDIDATSAALGVSLHTDDKYYKYDSGTYPNLQGVIQKGESVLADGSFSLVNLKGTSINHTGLTPNTNYYVTDGGGLTTTSTLGNVFLGRARTASIIDHALQFNASPMSNGEVTTGTDTTPKLVTAEQLKLGTETHSPLGNVVLSSYVNETVSAGDILGILTQKGTGGSGSVYNSFGQVTNDKKIATAFIASGDVATDFRCYIKKVGTPTDNAVCRIETDNAGEPSGTLANANLTASVAGTGLTTGMVNTTFTFASPTALTKGQIYWVVFQRSGSLDSSNHYEIGASNTSATAYANFSRQKQENSGGWIDVFTTVLGWGMDKNLGDTYWSNVVVLRTLSTLDNYCKTNINTYAPFAGIAQEAGSGYIDCLVFGKDANQTGLTVGTKPTWNDISGLAVSATEYLIPEIKDYTSLDIE